MTAFDSTPSRIPFSQVPHGLWTCGLSPGATRLLGWLWSHDSDFRRRVVTLRYAQEQLGGRVRDQIKELEAAGFLTSTAAPGKAAVIVLDGEAWGDLGPRTSVRATAHDGARSPRTTVRATAHGCAHREEQGEEQGEEQLKPDPGATASGAPEDPQTGPEPTIDQRADTIARAMFEAIRERTGHPYVAIPFPAIRALVKPYLKAGHDDLAIRAVLARLWQRGAPITRGTIDAELRDARPQRARRDVVVGLAGLHYDDDGNLTGA